MRSDDWTLLSVVTENDALEIEEVDLWWQEWHRLQIGTLRVPHPSYQHQRHTLRPYAIEPVSGTILFCAGELSNGVWCFYVPAKGQPRLFCKGMTVNERLYENDLLDAFDLAVRARKERPAKDALIATGLSQRQATETVEAIFAHPKSYGY